MGPARGTTFYYGSLLSNKFFFTKGMEMYGNIDKIHKSCAGLESQDV